MSDESNIKASEIPATDPSSLSREEEQEDASDAAHLQADYQQWQREREQAEMARSSAALRAKVEWLRVDRSRTDAPCEFRYNHALDDVLALIAEPAERLTSAHSVSMRARFVCPHCGVTVVDEDGCCRSCGADTTVGRIVEPADARAPQPPCRICQRLQAKIEANERQHLQTIDERDRAQEWADKLAHAIGGEDVGEHSNVNNPWARALEILEARAPQPTPEPTRNPLCRCPEGACLLHPSLKTCGMRAPQPAEPTMQEIDATGMLNEIAALNAKVTTMTTELEILRNSIVDIRCEAHGQGQQHAIDDVNAGRIDGMIAPRLAALTIERDEARAECSTLHAQQTDLMRGLSDVEQDLHESRQQNAALTAALRSIAEGDGCLCEHDTPDCCARANIGHCQVCIAYLALAASEPAAQPEEG